MGHQAINLRFYTYEFEEYHTLFLYEWLLVLANRLGIRTGTAIRAMASSGRFAGSHEPLVDELGVDPPIVVEFIVTDEEAEKLLDMIAAEDLQLSYTRHAVEHGRIGTRA
ncbi:MAG TPA: DUF190 domain-containing protein [Rhodanobacter sp.]|nr:DUF190 domain-containing protein [Rhodanobacter sp.]